jgi:hypothetical protein
MKPEFQKTEAILARLGDIKLNKISGAFEITTRRGAILKLCPNSDDDIQCGLHVDEVEVPEGKRGNGIGTAAMVALCRVTDEYHFALEGGPVGFRDDPFRERFVEWVRRLGFKRDTRVRFLVAGDKGAFYVRRRPSVCRSRR